MSTKLEAAARQALEALEYVLKPTADFDEAACQKLHDTAITGLREALAEQAVEPATEADMAVYKAIADNYHASLPQAAEPVDEVVVPPFLTATEDAYIAKVLVPLDLVGAVTVGAKVYTQQPAQRPDETLLTFYEATDYPSLVAAMEGHIKKLQSKLQANPHTAIDAWNSREAMRAERVTAPAQQAAEPVAWRGRELAEDQWALYWSCPAGLKGVDIVEPLYTHPAPTHQPVLVRDLAEILGVTVPEVCHELEECGGPRRSINMAVSGVEALAVAAQLKQAAKPVAMRYRFHYPDDGSKPYRTSEWKYTQGPWDKIPGNARDVSALSLHEAPTQQPLTDEQIDRIADQHPAYLGSVYPHAFARAIEAAHGITGSKT